MLSLPVQVQAVDDIEPVYTVQEEVVQPTEPAVAVGEEKVLPADEMDPNSFTYKQPVSKRKVAKKFLLAMGGVGISSLLIFLGLSLYNRIREGFTSQFKTSDSETSLHTPEDLRSAVKSFLSKTNWK